ncbi:hypothetical protein XENTR_v10020756 [Xenopus tropicalis]|nr:hypothetical protein XENTR_v10020756 [Xenopus tropicalis]
MFPSILPTEIQQCLQTAILIKRNCCGEEKCLAVYSIIVFLILMFVMATLLKIKQWSEKRNSKEADMEVQYPPYHIANLCSDENVILFEKKGDLIVLGDLKEDAVINVAYNPSILSLKK